jgi:hypothetical protein
VAGPPFGISPSSASVAVEESADGRVLVRHPSLTVTVDDPDGLARVLAM